MGKFFASASSLWVLFIPLLSISKAGLVDFINDCDEDSYNHKDVIMLIKQLGELRELGFITEEEFESKKHLLLSYL